MSVSGIDGSVYNVRFWSSGPFVDVSSERMSNLWWRRVWNIEFLESHDMESFKAQWYEEFSI